MAKSIILIYENFNYKGLHKWKNLLDDFYKIFKNVFIVYNQNKSIKAKKEYFNLNFFKNINFFLKNFLKIMLLNNKNINYLKEHPLFRKSYLKFIPTLFKSFYVNYMYLALKNFIQNSYPSEIFIMEPKNFLYSPLVILSEIISKELSINLSIMHGAFHLDNISFYKSLDRIDQEFITIFNNQVSKGIISNSKSKEVIEHLDYKHQFLLNKKNKSRNSFLNDIPNNKKIVVISLSKSKNFREFYFLENKSWINDIYKILNLFHKYNYHVVLRPHPLDENLNFNFKNVSIYYGSLKSLVSQIKIYLHLSTASHSFFDAIVLKIPVLIWSNKDLYSMKKIFPNIFLNNLASLENKINSQAFKEYVKYYDFLIQSVYDQTIKKKIKHTDLHNTNLISRSIIHYYKENY